MIEAPPLKTKATRLGKLFEKHGIKLSRKEQLEYIAHLEGAANWAHLAAEHPELPKKSQADAPTSAKERPLSTELSPVMEAFLETLEELDTRNNPRGYDWQKGGERLGWKIGNRVFVVEQELRNRLMGRLPEALRLEYEKRVPRFIHPATDDLTKELVDRKWCVLEMEDSLSNMVGRITLKPGFALWQLYVGASWQPHNVLIVDIPEDFSYRMPAYDSPYELSFGMPEFRCSSSEKFVYEAKPEKPVKTIILKRPETRCSCAAAHA